MDAQHRRVGGKSWDGSLLEDAGSLRIQRDDHDGKECCQKRGA
jgi:hypothetical protein